MTKFDAIDKKILFILQKDSTANTKEIAEKVRLSVTATYERIKRMEKNGTIEKYVAVLNKEKIGLALVAYCMVSLQLHSKPLIKKFEKSILDLDEIMECAHLAGNYDYLLKIIVKDIQQYQDLLTNKLAIIENIAQVHSSFVMTEVKKNSGFHLEF
jgi:Lrp/AsnC family transcriptional regulator, leucine-responsive regulatory protein